MIELAGKTALIIGSTGGMGKEISRLFASEGIHLYLVDREEDRLKELKGSISDSSNVHVTIISADLSRNTKENARSIASQVQQLDLLVYSAGSIIPNFLKDVSQEEFDEQFNVNFNSAYFLIQALIPRLKERNGEIVLINSSIINNPKADLSVYISSKHALKGFTDALRQEVNPSGVRVVNIVPGMTATGMQENLAGSMNKEIRGSLMIQPYDIAFTILHVLRLPRTAEITDVFIRPMSAGNKYKEKT